MRSSLYTPYPVLIGLFPPARYTARLTVLTRRFPIEGVSADRATAITLARPSGA